MLIDKLPELSRDGVVPMHMPGHKRNTDMLGTDLPYGIDITEISGFDDLHMMRGVLRETAELAAGLYGANAAFPMINGSTGGILAAVRACAKTGGSIVMQRYSHRSVYNAAELCRLSPVYIPQLRGEYGIAGSVAPCDVAAALESAPDARCVVITSPTYEGVVSDIAAIAEIAHSRGVPLIVDAAHGAHFGLSECFPRNAVRLGADIEVMSLHKTLPALTQCSLALVRDSGIAGADELERQLRVFETSSPSYVLLASIDSCLRLIQKDGARLFELYADRLAKTRGILDGLKRMELITPNNVYGYDTGKMLISTQKTEITGIKLQEKLRADFRIELEMTVPGYALAMTSLCDTDENFARLANALLEIDSSLSDGGQATKGLRDAPPERVMPPFSARSEQGAPYPLEKTGGKMSLEYVWAYPPGVPLLAPGEIVDDYVLWELKRLREAGIVLRSDYDMLPEIMCGV